MPGNASKAKRRAPTKRHKPEKTTAATPSQQHVVTSTSENEETSTRSQQPSATATRTGSQPLLTTSYQLKVVNACAQNHDIALPSRPTPGVLVALYTTGWREDMTLPQYDVVEGAAQPHTRGEAEENKHKSHKDCAPKRTTASKKRTTKAPTKPTASETQPKGATEGTNDAPSHVAARARPLTPPPLLFETDPKAIHETGYYGNVKDGTVFWPRLAALCARYKACKEQLRVWHGQPPQPAKRAAAAAAAAATEKTPSPPPDPLFDFSPPPTALVAALAPSQWMKSVAHVVLGRHSLLPPQLYLNHSCVSRLHARVVLVNDPVMHTCLLTMFPAVFPVSAPRDNADVYVSEFSYEDKPYYLLLSYGSNPLFVNGHRVPPGFSWPLELGDVISFLEDALDVEYGVLTRRECNQDTETKPTREDDCLSLSSVSSRGSSVATSEGSTPITDHPLESSQHRRGEHGLTSPSHRFLEALLEAVLRSVDTSTTTSAGTNASSDTATCALMRFATGSFVFRVLPGSVDVSPSAKRFVRLWMQLMRALRAEAEVEGAEHHQRNEAPLPTATEASATPGRFIVERNHLLLREGNDGASPVQDLSESPAPKASRKQRLPKKQGKGKQAVASTKKHEALCVNEEKEEDNDASEAPEAKRVRHFLTALAKELESIARRHAQNRLPGSTKDPFPEDDDTLDRENEMVGEAPSPLRARLTLDAKALHAVYLSLLSQAAAQGLVEVDAEDDESHKMGEAWLDQLPGSASRRDQKPLPVPLTATPRTLFAQDSKDSDDDSSEGSYLFKDEAVEEIGHTETPPLHQESTSALSVKAGSSDENEPVSTEAESPIKRLLQRLKESEELPLATSRQQARQTQSGTKTTAKHEDSTPPHTGIPRPLQLQSLTATTVTATSRLTGSTKAEDEEGEAWQERAEDGYGNPLSEEQEREHSVASASGPHAPCATSPLQLYLSQAGEHSNASASPPEGSTVPRTAPDMGLSSETPGGGISLDALLTKEDSSAPHARSRATASATASMTQAYRNVPALALHPAVLPVYVFTRRSPSPDTTTTRFARQSRAANRDTEHPNGRPEYFFYYDEEEQAAFEREAALRLEQHRKQQHQQQLQLQPRESVQVIPAAAPPGADREAQESLVWVDETAEPRKAKRRQYGAKKRKPAGKKKSS